MIDDKVLRSGITLAELGGSGDGPYCAEYGKGAALVMLGTYIVDDSDDVPYPAGFVFRAGAGNYYGYLEENIAIARKSGAKVGVSVVSIRLEDTVEFLMSAQEAGADYVSLCAHSTMKMFVDADVSSALCCSRNRDELRRWAEAIRRAVSVPVIFKIGMQDETEGAVDIITKAGIQIVHINVHDTREGSEGLAMVKRLKGRSPFLIVSGGIRDEAGLKRVLDAGADAAAAGKAVMEDRDFCRKMRCVLRTR